MKSTNNRKIYWIMPDFQKRFLFRHMLLVGGSVLATAVIVITFFMWQDLHMQARFFMVTDQVGQDPVVLSRWQIILPPVILAEAMALLFTSIAGLFYSHRLAGPVYRMKKTVEALHGGAHVDEIHLREKDEFQELAESINRLIRRK